MGIHFALNMLWINILGILGKRLPIMNGILMEIKYFKICLNRILKFPKPKISKFDHK